MLHNSHPRQLLIHTVEHKHCSQRLRERTDKDDRADQWQDQNQPNHVEQENLSVDGQFHIGVQRDNLVDGDDGSDCCGDAHANQKWDVEEERLDDVDSGEQPQVAEDEHAGSLSRGVIAFTSERHPDNSIVVHNLDHVLESSEYALDDAEAQPQDGVAAVLADERSDYFDNGDDDGREGDRPDGRLEVPFEGGAQHGVFDVAEVAVVPLGDWGGDQEHHAVVEEVSKERIQHPQCGDEGWPGGALTGNQDTQARHADITEDPIDWEQHSHNSH